MPFGQPATVAQLIARVRARADMVGSLAVTDTHICDWLSEASVELHDLLITVLGEDYLVKNVDVIVEAGEHYIEFLDAYLNLAPWRLVRLDRIQNGYRKPLDRFSLADTVLDETAREWDNHAPRYDWRYTTLWFDPAPAADETVTVYYVPYPQQFASNLTTETVEMYTHGHDRYLVLSAAIQCIGKQEGDATQLITERERVERMIRGTTQPKDVGRPATVADAQGLRDAGDPVHWFR